MKNIKNHPKDKWILICFLVFFGIIFTLDGIFVYTAITTQTGLVTDQAYEKGLNYNETLAQAKSQPILKDTVSFDDNVLSWQLIDNNDKKIETANVKARIIRPIQDGHDFDIVLDNKGEGIYQTTLTLPFEGLWMAKLESRWDKKTYKTTYQFIKK